MNDILWQRVEAALDARRDPLADPDLAAALACDPESLAAVQRLTARLELLPTQAMPAHPERAGQSLRHVAALAAGVLALATVSLLVFGERFGQTVGEVGSNKPSLAAAHASRPTVSLVIETRELKPALGQRVVLEIQHVLAWNLEER